MIAAESLAGVVLSTPTIINHLKYGSRSRWRYSLLPPPGGRTRTVLRTVYLPSNEVRSHLVGSKYPAGIRQAYETTPLPPWVYLIDVSVASAYGSLLKVGEVLIDGTVELVDDKGEYVDKALHAILVIHLPGMFWRTPFVTDEEPLFVDDDGPSKILSHATFAEQRAPARRKRR